MATKTIATKTIHSAPGSVNSNDFNLFQTWLKTQLSSYALRLLPTNPGVGQTVTWNGKAWVASTVAASGGGVGTGLDAGLPATNALYNLWIAFDTGKIYAYNSTTKAWVVILGPA
jgi:hypothetical protein